MSVLGVEMLGDVGMRFWMRLAWCLDEWWLRC